jgi:hypothetical protein
VIAGARLSRIRAGRAPPSAPRRGELPTASGACHRFRASRRSLPSSDGSNTDRARRNVPGARTAFEVFSYNRLVTFGISVDYESTPDIGVLAYGIEAGPEEMQAPVPQNEQTPDETEYSRPYE